MASGTLPPPAAPRPKPGRAPQLPQDVDGFIDEQIGKTRAYVKSVDITHGLLVLTTGVVGYLLAAAFVDHWLIPGGMGYGLRAAAFVLLVGGSAWHVVRRVAPLLLRRINPLYAAHTIEQVKPSFKNSLLSVLQLRADRGAVSEAVYQSVERHAANQLASVPVEATVDRAPLVRIGYIMLGVVVVSALYYLISPKDPLRTAGRVLLPWSNIAAPTRVEIREVRPGNASAIRGQQIEVSADVFGLKEDETASVVYSTVDGQVVNRVVAMTPGEGTSRHAARVPPGDDRLQQDIVYHVEAGDARSDEFHVIVEPTPMIEVVRVDYDVPAYAEPIRIDRSVEGMGDVRELEGTRVTIHAKANQAIARASVDFDCDGRIDSGMKVHGDEATATFTLAFKDRANQTPEHTSYQIKFYTRSERENSTPVQHAIDVVLDQTPEVAMEKPEVAIETPEDEPIEFRATARDPDFKLQSLNWHFKNQGEKGKSLVTPLLRPEQTPWQGALNSQLKKTPRDLGFRSGDVVEHWVEAVDNKTPADTANRAETKKATIKVLPPKRPPEPPKDQKPNQDKPNQDNDQPKDDASKNGNSGANEKQPKEKEPKNEGDPQEQNPNDTPKDEPADKPADKPNEKQDDGKKGGQKKEGEKKEGDKQDGGMGGEQQPDKKQPSKGDQKGNQNQSGEQSPGQQNSGEKNDGQKGGEQGGSGQENNSADAKDTSGKQNGVKNGVKNDSKANSSSSPNGGDANADNTPANNSAANNTGEQGPRRKESADNAEAIEEILKDRQKQEGGDGKSSAAKNAQTGKPEGDAKDSSPAPDAGKKPADSTPNGSDGSSAGKPAGDKADAEGGKQEKPKEGDAKSTDPSAAKGDKPSEPKDKKAGDKTKQTEEKGEKGIGAQKDPAAGKKPEGDATAKAGEKKDGGEKPQDGKKEGEEPGPGKGDPGGGSSGRPSKEETGAPQADGRNVPQPEKKKPQNDPNAKPSDEEAKSPASDKNKSNNLTKGESQGDHPGAGNNAGGEKGNQPGHDTEGTNSASDQGANTACESGDGDTSDKAGDKKKAEGKTGRAGNERGDASDGKATDDKQPRQNGPQKGKPSDGASSGKSDEQSKEKSKSPGKNPGNGGLNPGAGNGNNQDEVTPEKVELGEAKEDPADLAYAEKATDLALNHLRDRMKQGDDKALLDKLGWSREDAERFLANWEKIKDDAAKSQGSADAKKRLHEELKSLGLRAGESKFSAGQATKDKQHDLNSGVNVATPAEYKDRLRAYRSGTGRATPAPAGDAKSSSAK